MLRKAPVVVFAAVLLLSAATPSLQQVIARSLAARGGKQQFDRIHTLLTVGHLHLPNGQVIATRVYSRRPDWVRMELTLPGNRVMIQGFDGSVAWQKSPGEKQPERLSGAAARQIEDQATFGDLLLDDGALGSQRKLLGKSVEQGHSCTLVQTTIRTGDRFIQCIDDQTGLAIHEEIYMAGSPTPIEETISDYRRVAGVLMPFRYVSGPKGSARKVVLEIDSIEANHPMPAALFKAGK